MSGIPGEGMSAAAVVDALLAAVETEEEGEYLKDLLVRADLAKECTECGNLHRSAGNFCASCRVPFQRHLPADARWFILFEDGVWHLRNGVGADTLIFAHHMELGREDVQAAQEWAAGVMNTDYNTPVFDWSEKWEDSRPPEAPDYWIAATRTD